MRITSVIIIGLIIGISCDELKELEPNNMELEDDLAATDLVLAFVVFRHGDRTPDQEELALTSHAINPKAFYPFGLKALTNIGKRRGYQVGQFLRQRYDGFLSKLYIPDEIVIRTSEYARTKMTALTALAALYPPPPSERWNEDLDWQPVPYNTHPYDDDDLMYWYNCPRYIWLRNQQYKKPEVKEMLKPYQPLFKKLGDIMGSNITTSEEVFFVDNLLQALENVNLGPEPTLKELWPQIKEVTKIEYNIEFFESELIKLASGVLMNEIINATRNAILRDLNTEAMDQPKVRLYSAHENNVAALMAAANAFKPHQPKYGATFALELRKRRYSGRYGIMAVYRPDTGMPEVILPIEGCGDPTFCDYATFVGLTQNVVWTHDDFKKQCPNLKD